LFGVFGGRRRQKFVNMLIDTEDNGSVVVERVFLKRRLIRLEFLRSLTRNQTVKRMCIVTAARL
jgi:hypothetical protein